MCSYIFRVSHSPSRCLNFIFYFIFLLVCQSLSSSLSPFFSFYLFIHFPILFLVHSPCHSLFISFFCILYLSNSPPHCSILFSYFLCHCLSQLFSILFLCVFFYLSPSLILPFLLPISFSNFILLSKIFSCIFFYYLPLIPIHSTFFLFFFFVCVFLVSHSLSPFSKYFLSQFF